MKMNRITPSFKIIAHRGSSYEAPENSISSVKLAIRENADAIEVDIHLTKDNQLVVIHDANIKRTAGVSGEVKKLTLQELRQYDYGSWKSEKWKNERIPTLKEIFNLLPVEKTIFIEIKSGPECLPELEILIRESKVAKSRIVIMAFDLETVVKARSIFSDIEILWLYEFNFLFTSSQKRKKLNEIIRIAHDQKLDGINIENVKELDEKFIAKTQASGLKCYCWTVDDPERAKYLMNSKIDGVTTNRPGWMKSKLKID